MIVLLHCFHCSAGLAEIHEATGLPKWRLLEWPPAAELGEPLTQTRAGRASNGHREELPSQDQILHWCRELKPPPLLQRRRQRFDRKPLEYLLEKRGLTEQTIERYELGYGRVHWRPRAFMFPVRNELRQFVTLKERYWPNLWLPGQEDGNGVKTRAIAGHGSHLYPMDALLEGPDAFVVCEGEFDALLLNQHGVSAATSTAGTSWKPEWDEYVGDRFVAVVYDAGPSSYEVAESRASQFRAAGARDAWPVDLTLAGFDRGEDMTDWFVTYGWTASELRAFINKSRRWYHRDKARQRRKTRRSDGA